MNFNNIGKILIFMGLAVAAIGVILMLFNKIPFLGKMPGDIMIKGEKFQFYFPIVTCIVISLILSLIFYLVRFFKSN